MRRNVLSEVFLKDMLAGEVILPGETIKRFPGDRTFALRRTCGMGWISPEEPPRRTHWKRDHKDPHQYTSGNVPYIFM